MEQKINLVELLKDCPKGMELDCTIWDSEAKVFLETVLDDDFSYPIEVTVKYDNNEYTKSFTKYGAFNDLPYCNCVIFPKGKTTWEGFVPPYKFNKFKDGDIVYVQTHSAVYGSGYKYICIYKENSFDNNNLHKYVAICENDFFEFLNNTSALCYKSVINNMRLATEEEKEKLFQVIKDNGYNWNPKTKTLEKLPKFKDGDVIYTKTKGNSEWLSIYKEIKGNSLRTYVDVSLTNNLSFYYNRASGNMLCLKEEISEQRFATEEEKEKLFKAIKDNGYNWKPETKTIEELIKPKFKVGDTITNTLRKETGCSGATGKILQITDEAYIFTDGSYLLISNQKYWELASNKFDITKLTPFKSAVLIRNDNTQKWIPAFWGYKDNKGNYVTTFGTCRYCIPYEGNENLLSTNNDCPEYYKTWE